jgi:hypothetical protein
MVAFKCTLGPTGYVNVKNFLLSEGLSSSSQEGVCLIQVAYLVMRHSAVFTL